MTHKFNFINHDLLEINYSASKSEVILNLMKPGEDKHITLKLCEVYFFKYSDIPDEPTLPCFIDAEILTLSKDETLKTLSKLGYDLSSPNIPSSLVHFHGESEVVLDILAKEVKEI